MQSKTAKQDSNLQKPIPVALDLEEAVLGAVILQSSAIDIVYGFLRHNHFFSEDHQLIYSAVVGLHAGGQPTDMRSVIHRLRESGNLDKVGGHNKIVELTDKVSSAANIEHHARKLIEFSVKRDVITLSGKIQKDAYEDTSDAIEVLERYIADINAVRDRNFQPDKGDIIKSVWPTILIDQKPPEVPPLIKIGYTTIATPGNHSLLVGKKKSRKSLGVTLFLDMLFKQTDVKPEEVALFDTEQGEFRAWKYMDRIKRMTGHKINVFNLRGKGYKERKEIIEQTIKHWPHKLKFAVIDGIRDTVADINDAVECTEIITWLEHLTASTDIHIMNILHLNKTDGNARGHIGSELLNKAEVTIELEIDEKAGCTVVRCESSRDKPFNTFAFTHSEDDLPVMVMAPVKGMVVQNDDLRNRLHLIFEDGNLKYRVFATKISEYFNVGEKKARAMIAEWRRLGYVMKNGPDGHPTTEYKLLISEPDPVVKEVEYIADPVLPGGSQEDLPF
jgi:hypothetical protein